MALLEVENVHTYYGNIHALKGVSLTVDEGEIVTLIGANGAGKSTMLKTISGLLRPREGVIRLAGEDLSAYRAHEVVGKGVVQVPEGRRVFGRLTVTENLEMGAYSRASQPEIADSMERVFNLFPRLKERRHQLAGTLSGGEQQMLATGRALMARPRVLLMDEPSMGLAPLLVQSIFDTIRKLHAEQVEQARNRSLLKRQDIDQSRGGIGQDRAHVQRRDQQHQNGQHPACDQAGQRAACQTEPSWPVN